MFIEDPDFFPRCISIDASGGPSFKTEIVSIANGFEQRNQLWRDPLRSYEVGLVARAMSEWFEIRNAHLAAKGSLYAFRFEDPWDNEANDSNGIGTIDLVDGLFLLVKHYPAGSQDTARAIEKPKGSIAMLAGGTPIGGATVDMTTGIVTLPVISTASIASITKGTTTTVNTAAPHGLATGDVVRFAAMTGMVELAGLQAAVTVIDADTFTVEIDSTDFATFASGNAQTIATLAEALTWDGAFDVPVRFTADRLDAQIVDREGGQGELLVQVQSVQLMEVRP